MRSCKCGTVIRKIIELPLTLPAFLFAIALEGIGRVVDPLVTGERKH